MSKQYLVTGGAGFIGSNYVERLLRRGEKVTIFDNLSRKGAELNLAWLSNTFGKSAFELVEGDIRDFDLVQKTAKDKEVIIHLAAQVAVTSSVTDPRTDFEINALGTFNVMESARLSKKQPIVLYASTNKVYGGMEEVRIVEDEDTYRYENLPDGVAETQPLDFHSPYGCSKGTGDQYVHDYHRIYGLPTVIFRQSCIYGTRQFGVEDQGWVAWFVIAAVCGKPITIYGDGKQVRDILFIDDLLDVYDLAVRQIDHSAGKIYNIGGGPQYTLSIWKQFAPMLEKHLGKPLSEKWGDWRPGDQKVYISDIHKAAHELSWNPLISPDEGIRRLFTWVQQNQKLFVD
jgi:CDP-paratose 2-epimerase